MCLATNLKTSIMYKMITSSSVACAVFGSKSGNLHEHVHNCKQKLCVRLYDFAFNINSENMTCRNSLHVCICIEACRVHI